MLLFRTDSSSCSDDTNQMRKGRLSSRMLIPGNTWQAVWNAAKPVPARRQVLFFFVLSLVGLSPCLDLNFSVHFFSFLFWARNFPFYSDAYLMIHAKQKKYYIFWKLETSAKSYSSPLFHCSMHPFCVLRYEFVNRISCICMCAWDEYLFFSVAIGNGKLNSILGWKCEIRINYSKLWANNGEIVNDVLPSITWSMDCSYNID